MGIVELISSMDWDEESYPQYEDFFVLPFFVLFFPTVRFLLDRFVFEDWSRTVIIGLNMLVKVRYMFLVAFVTMEYLFPMVETLMDEYAAELKVGRRLIFGKGMQVVENESEMQKKKISKFKESAWKCVYYLSAEIFALSVTHNEPWFTNTKYFWTGPGNYSWPDLKYKMKLKGLYMYTGGFYIYSIFALIFWETRRSDFGVSMGHHVVTSILIVLSYTSRFARVGSVVLALHDGTDVFVEVGKMSKYSGAEALASCSFVMFVIMWVLLRLIYYPFWILWSTSYELIQYIDKEDHKVDGPIYYYVFNSLLFSLLVLHIYWWVLMYRMLVNQIKAGGKVSEDVRSDSEDEDAHED